MLNAPSPAGRKRRAVPVGIALLVAALLPGHGAAGEAPDAPDAPRAEATAASPAPPQGEATSFVEARDAYERARSMHRDGEYAHALGELDGAIRGLNRILTTAQDVSVRRAAGDLLRRVGSLRLACTRAIENEKQKLGLIGPPAPPSDAEPQEKLENEPEEKPGESGADSAVAAATIELSGMVPGIESVENGRVRKWMDFYTGRGRKTFEAWLKRSGLYMEWMKGILKSEGLPTDLVHLVFVESGFNPHARSRSHAVGPWQFIRGTAKLFGLKVDRWIDERKDPERATVAAARYLKHLYSLFESWPLALAGYNAGEGTILKAMSRQGTNDFWQLRLPRETSDYVPRFLACLSIAREPERYGFDVEREAPLAFDTVTLPQSVDLRAVAAGCGVTVETLRLLNPALLRHAAPTNRLGLVTLRVPAGTGESLRAGLESGSINLPAVSTPPDPSYTRHKVRRGESLLTIARRYGVSVSELARANGLSSKARVKRGRTLRVPTGDDWPARRSAATRPMAGGTSAKASDGAKGSVLPVYDGVKTIRIRSGDTLAGIAERHGTDVRTLRALNNLRPRQQIKAGARLKVPTEPRG